MTGGHTDSNGMTGADRSKAVVPDLAEYQFATLRKDGEVALCGAMAHNASAAVLVLSPVAEQPTPATLARLEHGCSKVPKTTDDALMCMSYQGVRHGPAGITATSRLKPTYPYGRPSLHRVSWLVG